jgi:hypothetical protein
MKRNWLLFALFFGGLVASDIVAPSGVARGQGIADLFHPSKYKYKKQEPYKPNIGHQNDKPCLTMVQLANIIDIVERDLREDGTVVIQQPSVWGQARMTVYRKDFDTQMSKDLDQFKFILSARVARSDQASLQSQAALGASLTTATPGTSINLATDKIITERDTALKAAVDLLATDKIKMTDAFTLFDKLSTAGIEKGNLGVEPTIFLDEKKRYLDHLNQIRRINMGDDTADSAGYGLYLVRMPVSIEPGQKSNSGHGAMLNVTAQHQFGPLFLQQTFRNLVINDLVDQLTPILFEIREHDLDKDLTLDSDKKERGKAMTDIRLLSRKLGQISRTTVNGKAYPVAPSDLLAVLAGFIDDGKFSARERCAIEFLKKLRDAQNTVRPRATDIRLFLQHELEAAYDIMERGIGIPGKVEGKDIPLFNFKLMDDIVGNFRSRHFSGKKDSLDENFDTLMGITKGKIADHSMGILCWAIAVDAALLNERLRSDIERVNGHRGFHCSHPTPGLFFYLPPCVAGSELGQEASQVFEDYIKARWPLLTFSLDPVVDQQNIQDALSVRRDLQLAMAFAFSTGRISFNQMTSFSRQVAVDAETIALNRTVTCFSHGNDTFGWRFSPRFQNPPNPSNARTLAQLATWTGPHPHYQVNKSKLERGQRELTVVIVMPSFLNSINLDVRGNYFKLTHPENHSVSSGRMLEQGRAVKELIETKADTVCDADKYRPEDIKGLRVKLEQLKKMLPVQSYEVNVPYENTLGGFDLFVPGTTALVPILAGYDGVDQVTPGNPTDATLSQSAFLIYGKHFSILETKVVAGGRYVQDPDVEILSREVMRVKIPKDVQNTQVKFTGGSRPFIEVHVATPNGISNRILIPVVTPAAAPPVAAPVAEYAFKDTTITVRWKWDNDQPKFIEAVSVSNWSIDRQILTGLTPNALTFGLTFANPDPNGKGIEFKTPKLENGKDSPRFKLGAPGINDLGKEIFDKWVAKLKTDRPLTLQIQPKSIAATPDIANFRQIAVPVGGTLNVVFQLNPEALKAPVPSGN